MNQEYFPTGIYTARGVAPCVGCLKCLGHFHTCFTSDMSLLSLCEVNPQLLCWFASSLLTGWRRKHLTMPLQNWIPWVRKAIRTLRLSCSCYVTTWHYGPQMCRETVRKPWLYSSGSYLVFLLSLFAPFFFLFLPLLWSKIWQTE